MPPDPIDYQSPQRASTEMPITKCLRCGGADLVVGTLNGEIGPRFMPKRLRSFWTFNGGVKAHLFACLTCGALTAEINPDDLRKLLAK
jgi:hypothetical protein